jgi:hypothetical protein
MSYPFHELLDYYPRDYYWMYLAVFQLFAYIIFMISNHVVAPNEKKLYSSISVGFALVSATVLLSAYFIQFAVIPISMIKGETEGIALLTQYNGHGIFIAMEELGFLLMGISFLFLSPLFIQKNRLDKSIRILAIIPIIVILLSFIYYTIQFGLDRSYRFEVAAITVDWFTAIVLGILISINYKKRIRG